MKKPPKRKASISPIAIALKKKRPPLKRRPSSVPGLRDFLIYSGHTADSLAKLTGISRISINAYNTGRQHPDMPNCKRIATALGITLDKLLSFQTADMELECEYGHAWNSGLSGLQLGDACPGSGDKLPDPLTNYIKVDKEYCRMPLYKKGVLGVAVVTEEFEAEIVGEVG